MICWLVNTCFFKPIDDQVKPYIFLVRIHSWFFQTKSLFSSKNKSLPKKNLTALDTTIWHPSKLKRPEPLRKFFKKSEIFRQNYFYWAKTWFEFCKERDPPNSNGCEKLHLSLRELNSGDQYINITKKTTSLANRTLVLLKNCKKAKQKYFHRQ